MLYTPWFTWHFTFGLGVNGTRIIISFLLLFLLWLVVPCLMDTPLMLQPHVSFNSMVQYKHVMPNNKREKSIHVLNTIQHGNRKASKYQFFWNGCQSLMTTKSHIWICQIQMCDFVCFWRWLPTTNKGGDCFQFDSNWICFQGLDFGWGCHKPFDFFLTLTLKIAS